MFSNIAFTICSASYIGMAGTLRDSFLTHHPDFDFKIIIADTQLMEFENSIYAQHLLKDVISEKKYEEMAFKYDVTEFCTSLKPFVISEFLKEGYELVTYIDPDIYFYSRFNELYDESRKIYITPHIITMRPNYDGDEKEENFLKFGIYNCGFIAFRKSDISESVLEWWGTKLADKSYADAEWGCYTDQKWIDFLPSYVSSEDLYIIKNLGCNVAPWNFYEREIVKSEGKFLVRERNSMNRETNNLVFIHFSGYKYLDLMEGSIVHNCRDLDFYEDIPDMLISYGESLRENKTDDYFKYGYKYNLYTDGKTILKFHRRLYRRCLENGIQYENLFDSSAEFYKFLKKRRLLVNEGTDVKSKSSVGNFAAKKRVLNMFYGICLKFLGVRRFVELLLAMQKYSRFEEQLDNI